MQRVQTVFEGVQGAPWLSTMHFGTGDAAQDCVDAVGAFWSALDTFMWDQVDWRTNPDVEEIGVDGNLISVESTTPVSGSGAVTGDPLPLATQGLIRWRTGSIIAGRELKGKTFVPGLMEGDSTAGLPSAPIVAAMQSAADALIADVPSTLTILSITHGQARLVATAAAQTQWASLRSRRD